MKVLIRHDYKASKKEPFGAMLRRLHDALLQASIPVAYQFVFSDSAVSGGVSAVNRAVKKFPALADLVQETPPAWAALSGPRVITGHETNLAFDVLAQIADGLPRSLPFAMASVRFTGLVFGELTQLCGLTAADSWWINGRNRALSLGYFVDVARSSRALPPPEGPLGALFTALGKPKKTSQFPMPGSEPPQEAPPPPAPQQKELVQQIRARLPELVEQAALPHALPSVEEALASRVYEQHPLKPTLDQYFQPLGYSCKGGSGTFSLRRRTAEHHVVEVSLDVGTWSRSVTAHFIVHAPGQRCAFTMPVAAGHGAAQYPIGDTARWDRIVANLATLAGHLDRHVVPEITAAAGPAPEWFEAPQL